MSNESTAPERVYLSTEGESEDGSADFSTAVWCVDKINIDDVEYIRTDIVMEMLVKAVAVSLQIHQATKAKE